jgi:signal peptidase I
LTKQDNYIKRCIAIGGDVLEIKIGEVYVNGKKTSWPSEAETRYIVETNGEAFRKDFLEDDLGYSLKIDRESQNYYEKNQDIMAIGKINTL